MDPGVGICRSLTESWAVSIMNKKKEKKKKLTNKKTPPGPGTFLGMKSKASAIDSTEPSVTPLGPEEGALQLNNPT